MFDFAAEDTGAEFNDGRTHRYRLHRQWDRERHSLRFCMLNPSTADEHVLDPTLRRCVSFAKQNGYGGIVIVNLFSIRSPRPDDIPLDADGCEHPENDKAIFEAIKGHKVVAGWGAHGDSFPRRVEAIADMLRTHAERLYCLGTTASGQPRHPLYVPGATALQPWIEHPDE